MCVIQIYSNGATLNWVIFLYAFMIVILSLCFFFVAVHFLTKLLAFLNKKEELFTLCLISYIYLKLFMLHFFCCLNFFPSSHKLLLCERWKHVNVPFFEGFFCSIDLLSFFFGYPQKPTLLHHRNYQQYKKKVYTTKNKPRTLILISLYLLHQITLFFWQHFNRKFYVRNSLVSSCQMAIVEEEYNKIPILNEKQKALEKKKTR